MKNLQAVSGFFFFFLGLCYFFTALLVYNQHFVPQSQAFFNILDLPFALMALLYASSSVIVTLEEYQVQSKMLKYFPCVMAFLIFIGLVSVNFLYPDIL